MTTSPSLPYTKPLIPTQLLLLTEVLIAILLSIFHYSDSNCAYNSVALVWIIHLTHKMTVLPLNRMIVFVYTSSGQLTEMNAAESHSLLI